MNLLLLAFDILR